MDFRDGKSSIFLRWVFDDQWAATVIAKSFYDWCIGNPIKPDLLDYIYTSSFVGTRSRLAVKNTVFPYFIVNQPDLCY